MAWRVIRKGPTYVLQALHPAAQFLQFWSYLLMPPEHSPHSGDLQRKHIWLSADDWEWLTEHFSKSIGASKAIRMIIAKFRKHIEAKAAAASRRPENEEIE